MYEYHAEILRVVDGDTVHARLDLGIDVRVDAVLRLAGINAPELPSVEGMAAKVWLTARLAGAGNVVTVKTVKVAPSSEKREKYGRWLAYLWDGTDINQEMVDAGQAVAYDGHGPRS